MTTNVSCGLKKQGKYLVLFLFCLFILTEAGLRIVWYVKYKTFDIDCKKTKIFIHDPHTAFRLKPGYTSQKYFNERYENDVAVIRGTKIAGMSMTWRLKHKNDKTFNVNKLGFRGKEIDIEDKSKFRILCLGGSTTMGNGISDNETWPAYLEEYLRKKGFKNIEVINGGIGGMSSRHELIFYKIYGSKIRPNIILIHDGWNEISVIMNMRQRWNKAYLGGLHYLAGVNKFIYNCPLLIIRIGYNRIKSFFNGDFSTDKDILSLIKKDFWILAWKENLDNRKNLLKDNKFIKELNEYSENKKGEAKL